MTEQWRHRVSCDHCYCIVIQLSAWSKKIISACDTIAGAGRLCGYDLLRDNNLSLDLILFQNIFLVKKGNILKDFGRKDFILKVTGENSDVQHINIHTLVL